MYKRVIINKINFDFNLDIDQIGELDNGNDFESIVENEYSEIANLMNYLRDLPNVIFARLTGSGSCIFAAFDNKKNAEKSSVIFKDRFKDLWFKVVENNFRNLRN